MKTCRITTYHLSNPMTAAEALTWFKETMMPNAFLTASGCFYNYNKTFGGKLVNAYNYAVLRKDPETGKTIRRGTQKDAIREQFANILVSYYVITEDHEGNLYFDFHNEDSLKAELKTVNRMISHGCNNIIVEHREH